MRKVNGILVPGGGSAFNNSFGIDKSTNEIFQIAKLVNNICNKIKDINMDRLIHLFRVKILCCPLTTFCLFFQVNNANDHFPILGICLGFELLLMASINWKFPFSKCDAQDIYLPLTLVPEMEEKSVLFKNMPKDIRNILLTKPVTANHH